MCEYTFGKVSGGMGRCSLVDERRAYAWLRQYLPRVFTPLARIDVLAKRQPSMVPAYQPYGVNSLQRIQFSKQKLLIVNCILLNTASQFQALYNGLFI